MPEEAKSTKVVVEIPEVKTVISDVRVCWGCLSSTCLLRQKISAKVTGKKLVNRHCMTRRTVLGDKNLMTSLQAQVGKDNHVAAYEKKKGDKKKFKGKLNHFSAAVIKKIDTNKQIIPEEKLKRVNLTGIPDEELYGPDFLYEETEICTEKKIISTNPVGLKQEPSYSSESDNEFDISDMDDEVQCAYCGQGVPSYEEQHHINTMHQDEDEEIDVYKAPDNDEVKKLAREVRNINGAMNDLSSSTMTEFRNIKDEVAKVSNFSVKNIKNLDRMTQETVEGVEQDINTIEANIGKNENWIPECTGAINVAESKLEVIFKDL
mgnify:CR=1 FL=1